MTNESPLPAKTYASLIVEAGVNAIPVVGGSLATLYFGRQQEIRFAKLEKFYREMSVIMAKAEDKIVKIEKQNKESLAEIIDEINDAVVYDITEGRRAYFRHCFYNTLCFEIGDSADKKKYFIKTLRTLTNLQIEILSQLAKVEAGRGYTYLENEKEGAHEFNAALESLRSFGFVNASMNGPIRPGVNWGQITLYTLSEFGREFTSFCLSDKENA